MWAIKHTISLCTVLLSHTEWISMYACASVYVFWVLCLYSECFLKRHLLGQMYNMKKKTYWIQLLLCPRIIVWLGEPSWDVFSPPEMCKYLNQMIKEFLFPLVFLYECIWLPSKVHFKNNSLTKKKNYWNANALAKLLYDGFDIICVKEI